MRRIAYALACGAALGAVMTVSTRAAEQPLAGKLVLVKNHLDPAKRRVKYLAKELASDSTVVGNPLTGGASFSVVMEPAIGVGSQQCFTLPASGWSAIGSLGFKYKAATGTPGAIKRAVIKRTPSGTFLLKVLALGRLGAVDVVPPTRTAAADVRFRLGAGDGYCSVFGGDFKADNVSGFKAKDAPAPGSCGGAFLGCSPSGAFLDG
jgi:hypothetical protein